MAGAAAAPEGGGVIITLDSIEAVDRLVDEQFAREEEDYHVYLHDQLGSLLASKSPLTCRLIREIERDSGEHGLTDVTILKRKLNNVEKINAALREFHGGLVPGGVLLGKAEPLDLRKARIFAGKNELRRFFFRYYDFLFKRVFPVLPRIGPVYRKFVRMHNRALSKCDVIGRLFYCGFHVRDVFVGDAYLYFHAVKDRAPLNVHVSHAFIFRQPRIGRGGRVFGFYKFRTMYAYAPFVQEFITERNKLDPSGKVRDDFRINTWGRLMRKYWIDELPMIWNWLRGDLKLVGVRPLSRAYFHLYPEDLRHLRIRCKPGLIPPYYADLPNGFDEIVASERRYLERYFARPWRTDLTYLGKVVFNIVARGARSN